MKCEYSGCKKEAAYKLKQLVGKKQTLHACKDCAPQWVKEGKTSRFYRVEKVNG